MNRSAGGKRLYFRHAILLSLTLARRLRVRRSRIEQIRAELQATGETASDETIGGLLPSLRRSMRTPRKTKTAIHSTALAHLSYQSMNGPGPRCKGRLKAVKEVAGPKHKTWVLKEERAISTLYKMAKK